MTTISVPKFGLTGRDSSHDPSQIFDETPENHATTVQRIGRLHQLRWMLAEIPLSADVLASDSSEVRPVPFFLSIAMRRTVV
jgi:hypothetical protein